MNQPLSLSAMDVKVLKLLQSDASASRQDLAEAAGTSPSTLWRKINELEAAGAIRKRVAILDPELLGVPVCVFLSVNLVNYDINTRNKFEYFVSQSPEILECFSITGAFDYMLIVRTRSVSDFEAFLMDRILGHKSVASASSQICLRLLKYTTALPL